MLDNDIDLLESYLDGDLPVCEAEGLWRRLAVEPELTAVLDDLRAQRAVRMIAWAGMEPTDQATVALGRRVAASVRRQRTIDWAWRGARYVTAAAACIVIGFGIGWAERGGGVSGLSAGSGVVPVVAVNNANNSNDALNGVISNGAISSGAISSGAINNGAIASGVVNNGTTNGAINNGAINNGAINNVASTTTNGFPVAIRDSNGNLIGEPRFDSPQDATQFINDLNRSQTRSQPRDLGANVVPASVEQF